MYEPASAATATPPQNQRRVENSNMK